MELHPEILTPGWQMAGFLVFLCGVAVALWHMPWYWLRRRDVGNRLAISAMLLIMLWQLRAELAGGPAVHLLGATWLTLAFGWQTAMLLLTIVLATTTAIQGNGWAAFGANGAILVVLATSVSYWLARISERWLPPNLFVYLFAAAFFGAAITMAVVAASVAAMELAAGMMDESSVLNNYLPTSLLLLFPEAFLTGTLTTLSVVYLPGWMVSFDDGRYLGRKR
ncbi:MAG: energy-coupling factor ABC transporter permease [Gammaproteobacteria bacterium]|nr:energy-coupling factor ABC transporter permease [Gammaproteobacteria bacterium]